MKSVFAVIIAGCLALAIAGCHGVSAPYVMKMDRVDQNVQEGNRGYLRGTPPPAEDRSGLQREFIAVDVDLPDTCSKESAPCEEKAVVEQREAAPAQQVREEEVK